MVSCCELDQDRNSPFCFPLIQVNFIANISRFMKRKSFLKPAFHMSLELLTRYQVPLAPFCSLPVSQSLFVLLDLSAAFDTLDHQIFLARLRKYSNFTETALKWFSSYLLGRSQRVSIADAKSPPRCLEYGIPQGSIVGPLLFTLYMAPLQDVIRSHGLDSMFYADDTQSYIITDDPKQSVDSVGVLKACINDVFCAEH